MVCGKCGGTRHNSRTCTAADDVIQRNKSKKTEAEKKQKKKNKIVVVNDPKNLVYCLFDLETNGLSKFYNDIVEMYALLTDFNGASIVEKPFYSKCRPMGKVGFTEKIHGLSDEMLSTEHLFDIFGVNFIKWLKDNTNPNQRICLVAYNGNCFGFPFLRECCTRYVVPFFSNIIYSVDP